MSNMRIPRAAATLIGQVQSKRKTAKANPFGDADGFGVIRTIRFDQATGKWLEPLLAEIGDARIAGVTTDSKGLLVTFVGTTRADNRDDFPLDAAATLINARKAVGETDE